MPALIRQAWAAGIGLAMPVTVAGGLSWPQPNERRAES
jgi:hypothetical protein